MADLKLENITKRFKKVIAIENLNFEVKNNEFFVLFGPAGAGKTTTLNIIAGIYTPDTGRFYMNGKLMNLVEPAERNVAMVFENYALYPHMTVYENMSSPLRSPMTHITGEENIRREVTRVAEMLGIAQLLERRPSELSNGQRQRVALGRALVRKPEVYLMDEPIAHLDAKLRHMMRAELKEMQAKLNATTIYVTHDYLEALSLADRIAVLNKGQIVQVGTPDEIYYRPATEFVAECFGDPAINIHEGELVNQNGDIYVRMLGQVIPSKVPGNVVQKLKAVGRNIHVGIRPNDIQFYLDGPVAGTITGKVYSFEPLGAKGVLNVSFGNELLRIKAPVNTQVTPDQPIQVLINMENAIFFDCEKRHFLARSEQLGEDSAWLN
ncbi:sn-glycerol-3-phosphate import ATP-binding protein UgpC [Moorella thermoacetica]|uniref:sn-glycerol-3-phosphate import ATP-binding protein UgpC n=1 Tax=Neomoorella thermoacetica TaxID=1525 RepID=A0A1J5JRQ4_NEOTH|nr:ABC transporter ATP-binding protein [Moorella thermoacetica]OIQ08136.1 sn-glycerol-3-phosphate import ATP-binding protein UgpC [Moorella thermoacetica]